MENNLEEIIKKLKDRDTLFPRLVEQARNIQKYPFMAVHVEPKVAEVINAPNDIITTEVMKDLKSRADRGLLKYNTTLGENNKDDFMNHLYEELLDAAQYIKKEQSFIPTIQKLIYETPNDQILGSLIRRIYRK